MVKEPTIPSGTGDTVRASLITAAVEWIPETHEQPDAGAAAVDHRGFLDGQRGKGGRDRTGLDRLVAPRLTGAFGDRHTGMAAVGGETIDGGWTIFTEGRMVATGTNELLTGIQPKGIDFVVRETPDGAVSRRHHGIYELKQNSRRLCCAGPDAVRPTAFAAPKGSGHVLVTLERISE